MPDIAHQALERHIDLQHPDLAKALNSLADIYTFLRQASHNYENEPGGNPSSYGPHRAIMTDDMLREAAIAGYCFGIQFPKSAALSSSTGVQYSVFNNGSKTIIIDQIDCPSITAASQFYIQVETFDPSLVAGTTFTGIVGTSNSKLSIGTGATGISASYTPTPFTTTGPTSFIDYLILPANQTQFMLTPPEVYILPAGAKCGILMTVTSAGAGLVVPHFHLTELPF